MIGVLMPRARVKVLEQLVLHPERELYLRELAGRAGLALSSAQRECARLVRGGALVRSRRGRQTFYRANRRWPLYPELRGMLLKTVGLGEALRGALSGAEVELALVYGSVAAGEERQGSDVDVLVVGRAGPREVSDRLGPVEREIGRELNPVVLTPGEFRARSRRGDAFLSEVMRGPKLYLIGDEDEAGRLAG